MRPFGRRTGGRLARLSAFAVLALALVVSGALPASATNGNNGTLKVHELGTPSGTRNNDPKVCAFNLEGFEFDQGQDLVVAFEVQGGDEPTGVLPAGNSFPLTPVAGTDYLETQYFNNGGVVLANGHYKATAYGKDTGTGLFTDEKAKSKVFKVDCPAPLPPETGTVTVTKALAEGSEPAGHLKFPITVTCADAQYSKTFDLKVGQSATTAPLPKNTSCTVSEDPPPGWDPPTFQPGAVVAVVTDTTVTVTVTNNKPKTPQPDKTGTITVTKLLAKGSDSVDGLTFPVTVTCDKVEYSETFNLAVGGSETTDPLPVGTACTVSEEPPPGWDTPTFKPSAEVSVHKGDQVVKVVNNLTSPPPEGRTGKIKVTKTLAAGTVADPGQTFPITVVCEKAGYDKTFAFSLAADGAKVLRKLPVGAVCTVSEAVPSGWNTPNIQPTSEVTVEHGTQEITVVNSRTITPPPQPVYSAGLTLTKDNKPADVVEVGKDITYTLTATATGNLSQASVVVSDVVPTGTTYVTGSAKCLPAATCTAAYDAATRTVSWPLGTMNPGDSVKVTFKVKVNTGLDPKTVITNVGTVASALTSAISNETTNRLAEVEGEVIVGPTTPTTVTPAAVEGETLPATGAGVPVGYLLGTGIGLIALGALLTTLTRRSRST